jgi:hypothetical protein
MKKAALAFYYLPLFFWLFFATSSQVFGAIDNGVIPDEYALKAVCLYNFTQFTRWPEIENLKNSESIVIGVVGLSPFGGAIEELRTRLKKTRRRNITIVDHGPYREGMDLRGSHLLFISSSEKKKMKTIITSLGDAPVLTVSDAEGFLEAGGMISLVLLNNKVRWEINRAAISSAGLHISARLLQLAIRIENIPRQPELLPYKLNRENPWPAFQKALASHPGKFGYQS